MKAFLIILLFAIHVPGAQAKTGRYRLEHRWGLITTFAGTPAPSPLGENLAYNVTHWARLSAGVGIQNNAFNAENWGKFLVNWTVRPIVYFLAEAVIYVAEMVYCVPFHGHFKKALTYSTFLPPHYVHVRSMTTVGSGADFFVPGWNFSPTMGVLWASFHSGGTPNLPASASHIYYSWGVDWQSKKGRNFALGYNYCPKFAKNCGLNRA